MNAARRFGRLLFLLLFLLIGLVTSGAAKPAIPVPAAGAPLFTDDLPYDSLKKAVRINLEYLGSQSSRKSVHIAGHTVPYTRLVRSLEIFLDILDRNPQPSELDRLIKENFNIFQATGTKGAHPDRNMLVTGYFQPVFPGSLTKKAPFLYPLYAVPDDLIQPGGGKEKLAFGRRENGQLVPYWTRQEIEKQHHAAGYELVWLQDPYDAYLVHIQGSAIIQLRDGTRRGIHFAAKNGHPYRSIGSYLIQSGRLSRQGVNMQTIRDYVAAHPGERDEILHANPSFIFFAWTDSTAVIGCLGKELTAGRSVAVDHDYFPPGALAFLVSRRPTVSGDNSVRWSPLHRFVMVQDSGSAISGSGRIDLFWGTGPEAGAEAGLMKEDGTLYFFLAKEHSPIARHRDTSSGRNRGS